MIKIFVCFFLKEACVITCMFLQESWIIVDIPFDVFIYLSLRGSAFLKETRMEDLVTVIQALKVKDCQWRISLKRGSQILMERWLHFLEFLMVGDVSLIVTSYANSNFYLK